MKSCVLIVVNEFVEFDEDEEEDDVLVALEGLTIARILERAKQARFDREQRLSPTEHGDRRLRSIGKDENDSFVSE